MVLVLFGWLYRELYLKIIFTLNKGVNILERY